MNSILNSIFSLMVSSVSAMENILEKLRRIPPPVRKYLPYAAFCFFFMFLLLLFPQKLLTLAAILALLAAASVSTIYKRLTQISVGIELISFATILFLFAFGPFVAILGGFVITLASSILEGQIDSFPKQFFALAAVCLIMIPFLKLSLLWGGMVFVALRNILLFVMYRFLYGSGFLSAFGPVAMNLVLNYLLLEKLGEPVLALLR